MPLAGPANQTRDVWLDGEGFFRVTHQRNHERFVVHLPNKLNIEVLGTQFNVMARENRAKVVLNNGKIRLDVGEQAKDKLVMQPGDLFYADVKAKVYYRKRVDAAAQSAWQTGKLTFDGTTLQEVAQMLEDTYGVKVVIADPELRAANPVRHDPKSIHANHSERSFHIVRPPHYSTIKSNHHPITQPFLDYDETTNCAWLVAADGSYYPFEAQLLASSNQASSPYQSRSAGHPTDHAEKCPR